MKVLGSIGVLISITRSLAYSYRSWTVQASYPPLPGVLSRVTLIGSGKFPLH